MRLALSSLSLLILPYPSFFPFAPKFFSFFLFSFFHTFDTDTWAPPEDHPDARAQIDWCTLSAHRGT